MLYADYRKISRAATEALKTIQVSENIKITIDGEEFKPKDGADNAIKPFVYNGVAYVPMSRRLSLNQKSAAGDFGKNKKMPCQKESLIELKSVNVNDYSS